MNNEGTLIKVCYISIDKDDLITESNRIGMILTDIAATYQEPNFYQYPDDDGNGMDLMVTEGKWFVDKDMMWTALHVLGTYIDTEVLNAEEGVGLEDNGITWAKSYEYNDKRGILFNLKGYDENFWYDYD